MRHLARLLAAAILSIGLTAGTLAVATPAQAKLWQAPAADPDLDPQKHLNEFENRILAEINQARVDAGLKKVKYFESCVDHKSERWARRIKRTDKFEHRNQRRVLRACDLAWTGETLVRGTGLTPAIAVQAWLNSPSHRAVIMKPRARWAGIGVRVDSEGRTIGVLNFGDAS